MDKLARMRMGDMSSEDIFAIYTEYVKDSISKDLSKIYKDGAELLGYDEPWVFKVNGKKKRY